MKKLTIVLLFSTLLFAGNVFGQSAPLSKGQKQLNFGLGLNGWGFPVYASLDFAVHKDITLSPGIYYDFEYQHGLGVEFRGDYHFNSLLGIPKNFDFYAGAGIHHFFYFDYDDGHTDLDLQIGGRWYWSDKWGLNLEFGGGRYGQGGRFGLSMKL